MDNEEHCALTSNIQKQVHAAVSETSKSLFASFERLIDNKLSSNVRATPEVLPKNFNFSKKGNEKQFDFNSTVYDSLSGASQHFSCIVDNSQEPSVVVSGKRALSEIDLAMESITRRNKLIKLADMSDVGWAAVSEYEAHQLADDSEDEKRIFKAEARAREKIKEAQKKKTTKRFFASSASAAPAQPIPVASQSATQFSGRRHGSCYACGKASQGTPSSGSKASPSMMT
jgi:hypothetical protein